MPQRAQRHRPRPPSRGRISCGSSQPFPHLRAPQRRAAARGPRRPSEKDSTEYWSTKQGLDTTARRRPLGAGARAGMEQEDAMRIGVVGLGSMGMGMAKRLIKAGFAVAGADIRGAAVAELVAAGGLAAATP